MTSSCKRLPRNTFHEIYSYTQQFTLMLTSGFMHHLVHLATVNNNVLSSCNITLLSRTPAISIGMVWFLTWSKFTWHPRIYSDSKYVNIIDFESTILSHCYKDMGIKSMFVAYFAHINQHSIVGMDKNLHTWTLLRCIFPSIQGYKWLFSTI